MERFSNSPCKGLIMVAATVNNEAARPATSKGIIENSYLAAIHAIKRATTARADIPCPEFNLYFDMPVTISKKLL
jgi:hypothetical protein